MKIKDAVLLTGLTDRTIRYYIEEKLIFPDYTESYTGRRAFNFLPEDIEALKHISVLRSFDFTIEEIHTIVIDSQATPGILSAVKERAAKALAHEQERLAVLEQVSLRDSYTLQELAEELTKPAQGLPKYEEIPPRGLKAVFISFIQKLCAFLLVWLPIVFSVDWLLSLYVFGKFRYAYPVWNVKAIILLLLSLTPPVALLFISNTKTGRRKVLRRILLCLCVLSIFLAPISVAGLSTKSETTDFANYLDLDVHCIANRNTFFHELFPTWPHYFENVEQPDGHFMDVYLEDAKYYYRYISSFDYTYDIFAQWPLNEEAFTKEVARVQALFDEYKDESYTEMTQGPYRCLIRYNGAEPFQRVTSSYSYFIFAYNDDTNIVRYIFCDSLENGYDQPYYLSLSWE